ncbi:MAG TPA: hypothetical protein VEA79_09855 [Phenylobacterium sp.]|nr:hypothetical protein [Phenylobacterium sp.]
MRRVIATLFLTGALAGSAMAQEPATPADPAADPNAAAPAAPARPIPNYPVAEPQVAVQDPAWRLFPPAPKEPIVMPPQPTAPDQLQVLNILEKVCVPAVQGGTVEQLAPAAGMAKRRDVFQIGLSQKGQSISVAPLGSNKNVCTMTIEYAIDGAAPLRDAVAYWALTRQPQMTPYRKRDKFDAEVTRYTSSWEDVRADGSSKGVVFVEQKKLDGKPISRNTDRIQILYSERK